jgi:hypothetical protein
MIRYLAARRYNFIDAMTVSQVTYSLMGQHWWRSAAYFVIGLAISIFVERLAANALRSPANPPETEKVPA